MTTRARKTGEGAESTEDLVLDKKGYLHIEKDDNEAGIMPESWGVWKARGWTLVAESKVDTPVPDENEKGN